MALALLAASMVAGAAEPPALAEGHPRRYVVQEGDTLWRIAGRFLREPWRWRDIWLSNPQIADPDLIYPGDVLVLTSDGIRLLRRAGIGRKDLPTVRLKPQVRYEPLARAIPTIPPNVIQPFLSAPLVVEPTELDGAGNVVVGVEDEIVLGKYSRFYARGLPQPAAIGHRVREYRLFHVGREMRNPGTGELLGIEAVHLGDAVLLEPGEMAKLEIVSAEQEIQPGDRLLPAGEEAPLPYYHPAAPANPVSGWIVHLPGGLSEAGRFDVAVVSLGRREEMRPGDVLEVMYHRPRYADPVDGRLRALPDDRSGLLMVFRVFDKVSYALVMASSRSIKLGDRVQSPADSL